MVRKDMYRNGTLLSNQSLVHHAVYFYQHQFYLQKCRFMLLIIVLIIVNAMDIPLIYATRIHTVTY